MAKALCASPWMTARAQVSVPPLAASASWNEDAVT
jgi:hypothetical protein